MPALRPVHFQRLVRVFEQAGFRNDRQEADHLIYVKAGVRRPIMIPMYQAVPLFIIKNRLRTPGISRDRYFEFLKDS
jgi:predicted RNA binding protein YcfA (HicA-like mRNA interferase family)